MGLHEAAFRFGMAAVATGRLGVDGFGQVISMVFLGRGVESVSARFARLATAIKAAPGSPMAAAPTATAAAVTAAVASALGPATMATAGLHLPALPQPTPAPVYIGQFADAMLRSKQLKHRFPWAYEVTLNFLRMNLRGGPGGGLSGGAGSFNLSGASAGLAALEALERELAAHVVLNRWLGIGLPGSGVRTVAQAEERAVEVVEQIADPAQQVGWGVWLRVGRLLENEQPQLPMLLETMQVKSVMHTYELIDVNGEAADYLALESFDWGLQGLLACLDPSDGAAELIDLIYPLDEERVLLCLTIAARMAATHSVGSGRRWPTRDLPKFVAQLLSLAETWRMEGQQMSRAVSVVTLLWGWALPKREQLMDQCGSADEAREVMERTASSIWRSLAQGTQK
ncbi:unnamed protein product [Closterium sp. Yama58-4]|nr:unnamed protein product [Closterium sp. Yama58-4]